MTVEIRSVVGEVRSAEYPSSLGDTLRSGSHGLRARSTTDPSVAVTAVVVVVVVGFLYDYFAPSPWWVGRLPIPMSLFPSLALLVALARRGRAGRTTTDPDGPLVDFLDMRLGPWRHWREFYVVLGIGLVVAAGYYSRTMGSDTESLALLANALVEEAQFRYSIPLLIAAAALIVGAGRSVALAIGLGISSVTFAAMPGHLEQMTSLLDIAPFLAFAVLTSMVALRTRSFLPGVLAHTLVNICTLPVSLGQAPSGVRLAGVVIGLIGLVVASEIANQRRAWEARAPGRTVGTKHPTRPEPLDLEMDVNVDRSLDIDIDIDLDFETSLAPVFDEGTTVPVEGDRMGTVSPTRTLSA